MDANEMPGGVGELQRAVLGQAGAAQDRLQHDLVTAEREHGAVHRLRDLARAIGAHPHKLFAAVLLMAALVRAKQDRLRDIADVER